MLWRIKGLWRWLMMLVLATALVGCGSRSATGGLVVPMWHSLQGVRAQTLMRLVDRWNQMNPDGIVIMPEYRPLASIHNDVMSKSPRLNLPGLMLVSPMQAAVYARENLLNTLDRFVTNEAADVQLSSQDISDLFPYVLNAGRAATGNLMGIPMGGKVRVMLYNRDWLKSASIDAPPNTWQSMSDTCAIAANSVRGTLCFAVVEDHVTFEEWLLAFNTSPVTSDGSLMQANVQGAEEAMAQLSRFFEQRQAYRVNNSAKSREDFAAGLTLFALDWSNQLDRYRAEIKARANFDWDVMTLPSPNSNNQIADVLYESGLWVVPTANPSGADSSDTPRALAAWKFMRWLLETPQTVEWARATGDLPARRSAIVDFEDDPIRQAVLQRIAPTARPVPMLSGWGCVRATLASGLRQILDGQAITETLRSTQLAAQPELGFDCALR